ncbi:MerR family transcriptional regulator [Lachnospiraceae bacterium NSJ-143]|nr:MerR family transcriptional regulator [Lachnospiraceae bacterium NSJ-143]
MTQKKKLYTIGDISDICGVPVKTLRYYDEIKLLVPKRRDSETNYRYYTEEQMLILHNIRKLKNYGFSLDEVHSLVYEKGIDSLKESLNLRLSDIHEKIESLQELYNEIENSIGKIELSSADKGITVEEIPERGIIYTRRVEKDFKSDSIPVCRWFEIFELIRKNRLKAESSILATYHNAPLEQFLKSECDLEIGIAVKESPDFPFFKRVPSFKAVTTLHRGPLSGIVNTYVKTIKWANDNSCEINGHITEEFLMSPTDVKDESEYLTKIIIPVK